MNKEQHRREMFSISWFLLIMLLICTIINFISIARIDDFPNLEVFLLYFNGTILVTLGLFVAFLDVVKNNIIEYGRISKLNTKRSKNEQ